MSKAQLILALLVLAILLFLGGAIRAGEERYGALTAMGWGSVVMLTLVGLAGWAVSETRRRRTELRRTISELAGSAPSEKKAETGFSAERPTGPSYPHPVINTATCIGCHACVDACPHDVLAIVNGKATPVAVEQCMEDTSCQVECPTVPKSCIVVNTTKQIPARKVPQRDQRFMTNVPGIYLIGDVSGVPLIKNAINEGGGVIETIGEELRQSPPPGNAEYDVAIVGVGPAGLSAAVLAQQRGLRYLALEQDQVVATIQQTYQAGKYVFFNPVEKPTRGGIGLEGAGAVKESMIASWMETMRANGVIVHENESCANIISRDGAFLIETEQEKSKQKRQYRAHRVVLAIGNRGTPMRLHVPGEDLRLRSAPSPVTLCPGCGAPRIEENKFCQQCGAKFPTDSPTPVEEEKVKYKLGDPNDYRGRHLVVVGAGNSAIEAAVDLAAFRSPDGTRIVGWRDNVVSLVIRSNFKSDLKLGNKMLVYECIDEGRINAYFGQTIKQITEEEVFLMNSREQDPAAARATARFKNDFVLALIGGEKPTKFLQSLGIKIG